MAQPLQYYYYWMLEVEVAAADLCYVNLNFGYCYCCFGTSMVKNTMIFFCKKIKMSQIGHWLFTGLHP